MTEIDFGYFAWIHGKNVTGSQIKNIAQTAEAAGFDGVSVPDHIVLPEETKEDYPISSDGEAPWSVSNRALELFQVGTFIGAHTDKLTVTSNVTVVPWRHPVLLAKSVLTLDFLTEGRFEFGAGAGWSRVESETFDVPFEERGRRLDEFLELFDDICQEGILASEGEFHSFDTTGFLPVPETPIPIWIGGWSGATFRRVGQFGDGWTTVLSSPEETREARGRIMKAWNDFDRNGEPGILLLHPIHVGDDGSIDTAGKRLFGDPDDVIADVQEYVDAGVTRIDMVFHKPDPSFEEDYQVEQLERLGDEVIPSF